MSKPTKAEPSLRIIALASLFLLILVTLLGCQTLTGERPETNEIADKLAVASATGKSVAETILDAYQRGIITRSQAAEAKVELQRAKNIISAANNAILNQDEVLAKSKLGEAVIILDALEKSILIFDTDRSVTP